MNDNELVTPASHPHLANGGTRNRAWIPAPNGRDADRDADSVLIQIAHKAISRLSPENRLELIERLIEEV